LSPPTKNLQNQNISFTNENLPIIYRYFIEATLASNKGRLLPQYDLLKECLFLYYRLENLGFWGGKYGKTGIISKI
jgi:hypothetical protein